MNLFILDEDPIKAGRAHCDKHLGRMIMEAAEAICNIAWNRGITFGGQYMQNFGIESNPSYQWLEESPDNRAWVWLMIQAMDVERANQGWKYPHASCGTFLNALHALGDRANGMPDFRKHTPFRLSMGKEHIISDDPVECYRAFYQSKQDRMVMTWNNRESPTWFKKKTT